MKLVISLDILIINVQKSEILTNSLKIVAFLSINFNKRLLS